MSKKTPADYLRDMLHELDESAALDEIAGHGYVLTPGRYVGAAAVEDDGEPFEEKMARLMAEVAEQFEESARLEGEIRRNLEQFGYGE